ncbi:AsmA family protein [Brevundimonas sp. PAMC22021]|uniref:AsmA family protein n=1 Tax=Brevundimonas sp. PAMC22021 TaxID=2861285 RepID=UPI001C62B4A9|nr:AsmA family protein [Brevundimonas sp. PAMC22021]QYF86844.1 AsmA family protein [Brevundimonas sp. PAMC22021]
MDWVRANDPVYAAARHPGRAEKAAASVTLLLVAAVVIFLMLFDWNWLRGPIGRWASQKYDREVALRGDLDVNLFSWTPSVVVNDLKFGGPNWAREQDTANVGRIEASVRLRKLFAGQIEMPLLSFTRPNVVLIATEDGRKSWELEPDKPDDGEGMKLPVIQQLVITDGRLTVDEQGRDLTLNAQVNARETANDGDAGFLLDGRGSINGSPLTLRVQGGPFINIRRNRPYQFTAAVDGAGSRLRADGAITRPFDLGQFQATLSLQGQNLADLYLLTGVTLPNTPAYRLSGALARDDRVWTFNDLDGRVGASDLSGDVKVDAAERLRVEAQLTSRRLDLDDLLTVVGAQPRTSGENTETTSGAPGKLLPDATLQVERLRTMDGSLSYRAASVKANEFDVRAVRLGAELEGGVLNLDPVSFNFNRGELNGTAKINATRDTPYSAIDFRLGGYPLESLVPARGGVQPISGRMLGRVRLEGPGSSIHRFAAASKGSLSVVVPQGQMREAFAELLGINASAGLIKLLRGDQGQTQIRCAVADFNVAGGVASTKTFVIDTGVVLAKGSGSFNLGQETLNLRIDGDSKKPRLLRVWAPITIGGTFTAPRPGVDVGEVVKQGGLAAIVGAVAAPVAALFAFVDPGLAEDANCGQLIAGAR